MPYFGYVDPCCCMDYCRFFCYYIFSDGFFGCWCFCRRGLGSCSCCCCFACCCCRRFYCCCLTCCSFACCLLVAYFTGTSCWGSGFDTFLSYPPPQSTRQDHWRPSFVLPPSASQSLIEAVVPGFCPATTQAQQLGRWLSTTI